ncbi:MAG: flagellar basal body-associated FliL family protein [Rickettsiaceae bacterium H1]|nr:flagellar basal body-associated FliL family protein [Rickettsiaceae bacterium H1]
MFKGDYIKIIVSTIVLVILVITVFYQLNNQNIKSKQDFSFAVGEFAARIKSMEEDSYVYLRLSLVLEMSNYKDVKIAKKNEAKIKDIIYDYIYSLTKENVDKGSAIYFLKEGITLRINKVLSPVKVKNILFNNFAVE